MTKVNGKQTVIPEFSHFCCESEENIANFKVHIRRNHQCHYKILTRILKQWKIQIIKHLIHEMIRRILNESKFCTINKSIFREYPIFFTHLK